MYKLFEIDSYLTTNWKKITFIIRKFTKVINGFFLSYCFILDLKHCVDGAFYYVADNKRNINEFNSMKPFQGAVPKPLYVVPTTTKCHHKSGLPVSGQFSLPFHVAMWRHVNEITPVGRLFNLDFRCELCGLNYLYVKFSLDCIFELNASIR